jgi:hypothetical protein
MWHALSGVTNIKRICSGEHFEKCSFCNFVFCNGERMTTDDRRKNPGQQKASATQLADLQKVVVM